MNAKGRAYILFFTAFFVLLLYPSNLFSQQSERNNVAELMAMKLKQKVILTDEQTAEVKVILSKYIDELNRGNNSARNLKKAEDDIISILNNKQKVKYNIIEKDFFTEVNQRVQEKF
ncbi:MAG: hypothetical protein WCE54_02190 [Ignavibacteriaceae bacterium]